MPDTAGLLIVFDGIHHTLGAETILRERGVIVDLVPTPVAITLGCGFSILTPGAGTEGLPSWWYELASRRVIYRIVLKEGQKGYEEISRCEGPCVPPAGDHEQEDPRGGRPR